jgi:hypothetical protein
VLEYLTTLALGGRDAPPPESFSQEAKPKTSTAIIAVNTKHRTAAKNLIYFFIKTP